MSQHQNPLLLKILSGANAGAEMELDPGDWILGSDEESQLFVLDVGITAQHVLLHIDESGILTLTPKNGAVSVNGEALPTSGAVVEPLTVFTVGGTHMACGPHDTTWPTLSLPSLLTAQTPTTDNNETEGLPTTETSEVSQHNTTDTVETTSANQTPSPKKTLFSGWLARLLILLILFAFLVVDYTHLGLLFSDPQREAQALSETLIRRGFPISTVTIQPNGKLFVQAVVPSNATMDALVGLLEREDPEIEMSITSVEDVVTALKATAKRADAPLRIVRLGETVRIAGYVFDMLALEKILQGEAAGLAYIPTRIDVTPWEILSKNLNTLLITRQLENFVRFVPHDYRIAIQVRPLNQANHEKLIAFLREAEEVAGIEGLFVVQRWLPETPEPVKRMPQASKILDIKPTKRDELPAPIRPLPDEVPTELTPTEEVPTEETPTELTTPSEPNTTPDEPSTTSAEPNATPTLIGIENINSLMDPLLQQLQSIQMLNDDAVAAFSCKDLQIVGKHPDMGVLYQEKRYGRGARLPNALQVKYVTPYFVVLQQGFNHIQLCRSSETATEVTK